MTARLTVPEAAARMRVAERFVLDELRRKNLRGSKYAGKWTLAVADVDAYLAAKANVRPVKR